MTNYKTLMNKSTEIALATSVNNVPNVRIVNYVWDEKTPDTIYIFTEPESTKMNEIAANNNIAFTTIGEQVIQVQGCETLPTRRATTGISTRITNTSFRSSRSMSTR